MTLEFYEYDPYDAVIHKTADEAEAAATRRIEDFHSDAVKHGEWDEDVQLVEYGVVLPLGRATSHPTGAAAEPPEVNHRDYALAEVEVDAAEFWRELSERAPKLAAALDAAAPEARKHRLNVARAVGIYYSAEGHGDQPGPDERVLAAIRSLCSRRDHLEDALTEWRKRVPGLTSACSFVLDRAADGEDLQEAQELLDWLDGVKVDEAADVEAVDG